jgi:hypothetical protein
MNNFATLAGKHYWLHHPVIGDPSWDRFERAAANPLYRGKAPFEWPVNGFLFRDPVTGIWYVYVGVYPRGYWPGSGLHCVGLRSRGGRHWEHIGVVLEGDPHSFDGDGILPGGTPDVSVVYADGLYHMVYDWASPDNSDGGLAYAVADSPEGPFRRAPSPIIRESETPFLKERYKRVYAGTLIRRKNDWLILADMSTPRNAGGTWAFVALTAPSPEGPYTPPQFLLCPQDPVFYPTPVEFFPAFVDQGHVYALFTSVALNRSFQVVFRAPLEQAHLSGAWHPYRYGSVWHDEPVEWEHYGIWGQALAVQPDNDGRLYVMFPSKDENNCGTINIASVNLSTLEGDTFAITAPNGPAAAVLLRQSYESVMVKGRVTGRGSWRFCWNWRAPLGPNRTGADTVASPLTLSGHHALAFSGYTWRLVTRALGGYDEVLAEGEYSPPTHTETATESSTVSVEFVVEQYERVLKVNVAGKDAWSGELTGASGPPGGLLGFIAERGAYLRIEELVASGVAESGAKVDWLPEEGLMGSGAAPGDWTLTEDDAFRYGRGYVSTAPGAAAKWNWFGSGFALQAPTRPEYGTADLFVDGHLLTTLSFATEAAQDSHNIYELHGLPCGPHTVFLRQRTGIIPCDVLTVFDARGYSD